MKSRDEMINNLKEYQATTPSKWREQAEWRLENKSCLRHSQSIAMATIDKMEELGLTQKNLAERMGCSQQYVSKLLKGTENISLETIAKIEDALSIVIIKSNDDIL